MDQMPSTTLPSLASLGRRRFTVAECERMAEVGILGEDDRVELIDGEIRLMAAIGDPHMSAVIALTQVFGERLGRRALISVQNAVRLDGGNMPQPDVVVLKPRPDRYASGKPRPDDIVLLVEVADSSLDYDRGEKRELYARSGIAEYWVVNLVADEVEVCRGPTPEGYASVVPIGLNGSLGIAAFPGTSIPVRDILPPR